MREILISNNVGWHYEIIESVIVKYNQLLNIEKEDEDILYLWTEKDFHLYPPNLNYHSFISYIKTKYPKVIILDSVFREFDYEIHCTVTGSQYNESFGGIRKNNIVQNKKYAYISHDYNEEFFDFNNVFFLHRFDDSVEEYKIFNANILPYTNNHVDSDIPQIILQGSLDMAIKNKTRDFNILSNILNEDYDNDFNIKIVGRTSFKNKDIKDFLYSSIKNKKNVDQIKLHLNKTWKDYHMTFMNGYAIMPLLSKTMQPQYFSSKITSSLNYGKAYNLKFFIDNDFAATYDILDQSYIYDVDNIAQVFNKMLIDYKG